MKCTAYLICQRLLLIMHFISTRNIRVVYILKYLCQSSLHYITSVINVPTVSRALSEVVGERLPYDSLDEVRDRLSEISPALVAYGDVQDNNYFAQARALAQVYPKF